MQDNLSNKIKQRNILLVEDDSGIQQLIKIKLQKKGLM